MPWRVLHSSRYTERRRQLLEENERLDSYEDLICRMRDNESYFTDTEILAHYRQRHPRL